MALKNEYQVSKIRLNAPLVQGERADITVTMKDGTKQRLLTSVVENFYMSNLDDSISITTKGSIYRGNLDVLKEHRADKVRVNGTLEVGKPADITMLWQGGHERHLITSPLRDIPVVEAGFISLQTQNSIYCGELANAKDLEPLGDALDYLSAQLRDIELASM